ncbi:uncharacterized protein LOC131641479 [Vicia villosa]|uniref:uncharacterized protein LOC131641479 n=1 Tax=Vicia villosa TaxID=3911 RepID=UPI00273CAB41|nr:uncharacterized protein LOC131641479 [Vicia villosa]
MKGTVPEVAIFADTNLGTRIAFNSPFHITAGTLKRDFEKVHFTCLPDIGEIQVHGLMVRRKSCFYYLPDSFLVKNVFPTMRETWFLHVEVRPLKCLRVPCLPCDAAISLKQRDLMTCNCENNTRCNSEEKREKELNPCADSSEENEVIDHVLKEKGNSHENSEHGIPERDSCRFEDKPTSTASKSRCAMPETNVVSKSQCAISETNVANKSQCAMPETNVEFQVELCASSVQETPSKMSTQVISVSGIINKYFSGFNGIDTFSCSSNSDVTSRVVHSEFEVQSNTGAQSCSKKQVDSLSQFTPKTPPHVPLHVEFVSKNSGSKTRKPKVEKCSRKRRSKVEKCSKNRGSKVGKFLLSASKSLGASNNKQSPALSLCKFKNIKLLEEIPKINRSIFSICDSDD